MTEDGQKPRENVKMTKEELFQILYSQDYSKSSPSRRFTVLR